MAETASIALTVKPPARGGFTLVELLVIIAIIGVLAGLLVGVVANATKTTQRVECASKLRSLGQAILLYANDHEGQLPRSFHSAGANREPGWAVSIAPYLGIDQSTINSNWAEAFNRYYRSPVDQETNPFIYSYAMNVHFELNPNGDDYTGSPATWRRLMQIPTPSKTIVLAQTRPIIFGDHLMCHQWSSTQAAKNALNYNAHGDRGAHYLFADGHVELLTTEKTFDPGQGINLWNPELASQ